MKTVEIGTYSFKLHMSIGGEAKKLVQYINRKIKKSGFKVSHDDMAELQRATNIESIVGFYLGLEIHGHGIIWFNPRHLDEMDAISLSHEVIHACIDIFEHIGSGVNKETEEPFCYLHDFLMKECLGEIDKVKNGHNIKTQEPVRIIHKLDKGDKPIIQT